MAIVKMPTAKKREQTRYKSLQILGVIRNTTGKKAKTLRKPIDQKDSLLFKLPAELRNRIYRLAVLQKQEVTVTARTIKPGLPALLRTCQEIYEEAGSIYFGETRFILMCTLYGIGFPAFTNQMRHFFGDRGKGRKERLTYDLGGMVEDEFDGWMARGNGVFVQ